MASFVHTVGHLVYRFDSLKDVMAKASPARSGDYLAGVAASNDGERVAAQMALANIPLTHFLNEALIPYEADEVTRLIIDTHDAQAFAPVSHLTVGGLRDWLLSEEADEDSLRALAPADAGNGGGGVEDHARAGLGAGGAEDPRSHPVPRHHGLARALVYPAAAQPPDRRAGRYRRQHSRRAAVR